MEDLNGREKKFTHKKDKILLYIYLCTVGISTIEKQVRTLNGFKQYSGGEMPGKNRFSELKPNKHYY